MLNDGSGFKKVYLATGFTDMRRGIDGLSGKETDFSFCTSGLKTGTSDFEVESGDRMEFSVYGEEYGMLAEGDEGKLTFQGSRYLGFERTIEN